MPAEALLRYGTGTLFEALGRRNACGGSIRPLWTPLALAGPAFTVAVAHEDNLALHYACGEAPAGSVLVAAGNEAAKAATFGDVLATEALARGIAGLVTDGLVRDSAELRALGFPVFCRGVSPAGPGHDDPGERRVGVVLGGVAVAPGDWIVADEDGVVVVPAGELEAALAGAEARTVREAVLMERLRAGELTLDLLDLRGSEPEA